MGIKGNYDLAMAQRRIDFTGFHWLDVSNPERELLDQVAEDYKLHATSVKDCLEPEHLPKVEQIEDVHFVILRVYDPDCNGHADTVQELTRKIAIFYTSKFVVTIHRRDQPFITALQDKWAAKKNDPKMTIEHILASIANDAVTSFDKPVMKCVADLEQFEQEIFGQGTHKKFRIKQGYYLKRRVSVYKRLFRATLDPINHMLSQAPKSARPYFQNAREHLESLFFYADDTSESTSSLINLHISLSSQRTNEASRRTNEVVRVLTIFSCFFLPINFIAGVYGMNFEYMPELRSPYGYYFAIGLMLAVVVGIYLWFRKKGWMKRAPVK